MPRPKTIARSVQPALFALAALSLVVSCSTATTDEQSAAAPEDTTTADAGPLQDSALDDSALRDSGRREDSGAAPNDTAREDDDAPQDAQPLTDTAPETDAGADTNTDAATDADTDAATDTEPDPEPDTAPPPPPPLKGPPYPIVLAHGFFGTDNWAGLGFATYFYEVREHLLAKGEPHVFTPAVDPFNDSITRGKQLAAAVETIRQETGHAKVNLIGHSQGGLDSRYVAHEHPDWVASVTTISTPHGGSPVADIALMVVPSDLLQDLLDSLVQLLGGPIWDAVGNETSLAASIKALSPAAAEVFNKAYPDVPGVAYYSIAGRSDHHLGLLACGTDGKAPDFIDEWKWTTDPIDASLSITEIILDGGLFNPYPNDGLVRVADAKWGTFLGCIPADHLDQIGHLFGDKPGLFSGWSHKGFYRDLSKWLHAQGF